MRRFAWYGRELVRLKALVSSAFSQAGALSDIGATKALSREHYFACLQLCFA
jgi:hypothetical protein